MFVYSRFRHQYLQMLTVIYMYIKTSLLFTTSQGFSFQTFFSSAKYVSADALPPHFGFSDNHTLTSARLRSIIQRSAHSFIQAISIALLQIDYYSEALPTQHGFSAGVSRQSATGNCELRTCPRSRCNS